MDPDDEILDIFGVDYSTSEPIDDAVLDEDEVLRSDSPLGKTPAKSQEKELNGEKMNNDVPTSLESSQSEQNQPPDSQMSETVKTVLESNYASSLSSLDVSNDHLIICEAESHDSPSIVASAESPGKPIHNGVIHPSVGSGENLEPPLVDETEVDDEVLDYSDDFGNGDDVVPGSAAESVEPTSSSAIDSDVEDEDKERCDRFTTERKVVSVKLPGDTKHVNMPATLDDVVLLRPDGPVAKSNNYQNGNRRSRFGPKAQHNSPQKIFSVKQFPPQQQQRGNYGQSRMSSYPQAGRTEPGGFAFINPQFRGSVPVIPNVRLAWDHPNLPMVQPLMHFRPPPPAASFSNIHRFTTRNIPAPQPFMQAPPSVFAQPNRFQTSLTLGAGPPRVSMWPPTVNHPPPRTVFGAAPAFPSGTTQNGEKSFVGWDAETLAFINKVGARPSVDSTSAIKYPAFEQYNPSKHVNHKQSVKERVGPKRRVEDDDDLSIVQVKTSAVPGMDATYMAEMERQREQREAILLKKQLRRQQMARSNIRDQADGVVNIVSSGASPEKTLKKIVPSVFLKDLSRTIDNSATNTFRTYRELSTSSLAESPTQPPTKIIRLRQPTAFVSSVKTRITAPESSSGSLLVSRKNPSSLSTAAAMPGRVALITPIRQSTAMNYSMGTQAKLVLSSVVPVDREMKSTSLSDRFGSMH